MAFSEPSIGSITITGGPVPEMPTSSETIDASAEVAEHGLLGEVVDQRRVVAALALPQHRLAVGAVRALGEDGADVGGGRAAGGEPVGHTGWKSRPERSFG